MNERIWCVGDIHGCFNEFKELISKIPENEKIYLVGDMIDRGPDTQALLSYIIENQDRIIPIIGNHEQLMISSDKMEMCEFWSKVGGDRTMDSYYNINGIEGFNEEIFNKHVEWLKTLPLYIVIEFNEHKDLLISHSLMLHIWNTVLTESDIKDSQWQHFLNLEYKEDFFENENLYNIFGHTIQQTPVVNSNFACIDIGTFRSKRICALSYPDLKLIEVTKE